MPRYTAKSCESRYMALVNGTAKSPLSRLEDVEEYHRNLEERTTEFWERKREEREQTFRKQDEEKQRKIQARSNAKQAAEAKRVAQQEHREREARDKEERKEADKRAREDKDTVKQMFRDERTDRQLTRKQDKQMLSHLRSQQAGKRAEKAKQVADLRAEVQRVVDERNRRSDSVAGGFEDDEEDYTDMDLAALEAASKPQKPRPFSLTLNQAPMKARPGSPPRSVVNILSKQTDTSFVPNYKPNKPGHRVMASTETVGMTPADYDPREIMAKCELMSIVTERGMTKNREKETKTLLNRRIRESDNTASMEDIVTWIHKRGLSAVGDRDQLLWRLKEYDATRSRCWRPKHMALLEKGRNMVGGMLERYPHGAPGNDASGTEGRKPMGMPGPSLLGPEFRPLPGATLGYEVDENGEPLAKGDLPRVPRGGYLVDGQLGFTEDFEGARVVDRGPPGVKNGSSKFDMASALPSMAKAKSSAAVRDGSEYEERSGGAKRRRILIEEDPDVAEESEEEMED